MSNKIFRITEDQKSYIKFLHQYESMDAEQIRKHDSMRKPDGTFHRISTIKLWINRLEQTDEMKSNPKSGRPRKLNIDQTNNLISLIKQNPHMRYPEIKREVNLDISPRTINRRANERGIRTYRVIKRPNLNLNNKKKRFILAKRLLQRSHRIEKLVFTDKKKIMNKNESNVNYVNREKSKGYETINMRFDCVGNSAADVNVWGYLGVFGKGIK